MKTKSGDVFLQNKIFAWVALGSLIILAIPFFMTQVSGVWDWGLFDFVVIGTLLFGMGSAFVLVGRKVRKTSHRIALGIFFLLAILYIWAELAVGIFTNLGS